MSQEALDVDKLEFLDDIVITHYWHWRDEARQQMYERLEKVLPMLV